MRTRVVLLVLAGAFLFAGSALAFAQKTAQVPISRSTTVALPAAMPGTVASGDIEIDSATVGDDDADTPLSGGKIVNRSIATSIGSGATVTGNQKAKSNPELQMSFLGLTLRDQRLANGGNQFTIEPPDQGLCAGNGYVMETVNDVLRIYDSSGNPVTGVIDLNTFYGYPAAINRAVNPLQFGPSITDPSCYYDPDTQRWFHVVLTLDRAAVTTQSLSGKNHLDIAVSTTSSPLDPWMVYRIPVQNDGTDGTPNHGCAKGPCLGDYPHIGADAYGFFITTNEFSLAGSGFYGAQIYGISKRALAAGTATSAVLINTGDPSIPFPGFTVWPAISAGGVYAGEHGGTEYFLSSLAVFEDSGTSNQLVQWNVFNTSSLDSPAPALGLSGAFVTVNSYGVPPRSDQKVGDFPFGQCLADTTIPVGSKTGCWRNFFASGGPFTNAEKKLDSNDSRMQQVYYANGKLWGALDTAINVGGATKAGIAYFVLNPQNGNAYQQGYVAVANNNVSYPAVAVNSSGRGVIAFTLVGADHFPSAGYVSLDAKIGAGDVHVIEEGVGADDGFTGYRPTSSFGTRSRWGDYGAAVTDGVNIWTASEYIAQTCTLADYVATAFACGSTRVSQGNWATRVSKLMLP